MKENDDDDAVVKGNVGLFWVWVEIEFIFRLAFLCVVALSFLVSVAPSGYMVMMVMRVVKLPHELANEDANMCERERMFKDYL